MPRCLIVFLRSRPAVDDFALWNENCNQSQRFLNVLFWGNLPCCEIYHPCQNFPSDMSSDSFFKADVRMGIVHPKRSALAADRDTIFGVFLWKWHVPPIST